MYILFVCKRYPKFVLFLNRALLSRTSMIALQCIYLKDNTLWHYFANLFKSVMNTNDTVKRLFVRHFRTKMACKRVLMTNVYLYSTRSYECFDNGNREVNLVGVPIRLKFAIFAYFALAKQTLTSTILPTLILPVLLKIPTCSKFFSTNLFAYGYTNINLLAPMLFKRKQFFIKLHNNNDFHTSCR